MVVGHDEFVVRGVNKADLPKIEPILEQTIISAETGKPFLAEIKGLLASMHESICASNKRRFVVAEKTGGIIMGVMGLQPAEPTMRSFAQTPNPSELIAACVDPEYRGQGVGESLVEVLEDQARAEGYSELVVNSGPRYQRTGWPFWTYLYGNPVGVAKDYYGQSNDAMVWHREL